MGRFTPKTQIAFSLLLSLKGLEFLFFLPNSIIVKRLLVGDRLVLEI